MQYGQEEWLMTNTMYAYSQEPWNQMKSGPLRFCRPGVTRMRVTRVNGSQRTIRTRELDDMRGLSTKVEASDRYKDSKTLAEKTPPYPVLYKILLQLNMPWIYSNWLNIIEYHWKVMLCGKCTLIVVVCRFSCLILDAHTNAALKSGVRCECFC